MSETPGHTLVDPPLPYRMAARAGRAVADVALRQAVDAATRTKDGARVETCRAAFGDRYDDARRLAGAVRQHTLDHLDTYLDRFIDAAEAAGTTVHFASDAAEARAIGLRIAGERGCRLCVKSKSMVTEEIGLVRALQAAGVETVETDLGEFIVQLDGDAPSHIVMPMIHKDRRSVARAFVRDLRAGYTEDPRELTLIARRHMREKFRRADLGISGANFLLARTGSLVICTNEGNADLCTACPPIHVAFVGIEKLIPGPEELPVFLKLLARSATAQAITVYTTILTGPRRARDPDGPRELHIVLVDNGRTELLRAETRELLRCIRCGACLNACPVYRTVGGGHAYGAVYSGPIGAVVTPLFKGLANYPDLPQASSLCGACFEACPVHIDIPSHLIRLRRLMVERRLSSPWERLLMRAWAWTLGGPRRYRVAAAVARAVGRALAEDGSERAWIPDAPGPLAGWTATRDLPAPARRCFRDWWRTRPDHGGDR